MTFTESDAENDGKIKREAGQTLNAVLARESGELYTMYRNWCNENGVDPSLDLGDMILKAIKDEAFATEISSEIVSVGELKKQETKKEDLEFVVELIDEFGGSDDSGNSAVDELIEKRIEAIGSGPMGMADVGGGMMGQQEQSNNGELSELRQKVTELERELESERSSSEHQSPGGKQTQKDEKEDVDGLFDREGGEEKEGEEIQEDEQSDDDSVDIDVEIASTTEETDDENIFNTDEADIDD